MPKKKIIILILAIVILAATALLFSKYSTPAPAPKSPVDSLSTTSASSGLATTTAPVESIPQAPAKQDPVRIVYPTAGLAVRSPLSIRGEAKGNWFFEGSFPIRLLDASGKQLAATAAKAKAEAMTEGFVPFEAVLEFKAPTATSGFVVLKNDNPSGLPEKDEEFRLPISFGSKAIKLYYYNPLQDKDKSGNIICSRQGLVAVERWLPLSKTPIQDALQLLLQGQLTEAERAQVITTEYPLAGLELKGANLKDGQLTLKFSDPKHQTSGGSCRVAVLWAQIEATAKQFPEVKTVKALPADIFQP